MLGLTFLSAPLSSCVSRLNSLPLTRIEHVEDLDGILEPAIKSAVNYKTDSIAYLLASKLKAKLAGDITRSRWSMMG